MRIERPKSLTGLVVEELRARILDGRLRLGSALSENAVAAEMGLSKTPVREALLQLKMERLVEVQPKRGTYVFRIAADQVAMISELREVLEVAALARAMERNAGPLAAGLARITGEMSEALRSDDSARYRALDGQFHQTIIDLCGNSYFTEAYSQIGFHIQALRSRLSKEARLNRQSLKEHREMVRLIKGGEVTAVQELMRTHINQTRQSYIEALHERNDDVEAA